MDIVHLRSNEAATGCEKDSLFEDNFYYEKKMGQELSAIATTPIALHVVRQRNSIGN